MAEAWRRLADEIRSAMSRQGLRSQRELARAAGVSERTLTDLLSGRPRKWLPRTMPAIEHALGWVPGSARATLAGGKPLRRPAADDVPGVKDPDFDRQPPDVRLEEVRKLRHQIMASQAFTQRKMLELFRILDEVEEQALGELRAERDENERAG